jgi:peptidoglycan DL-endopeptidase CwlO
VFRGSHALRAALAPIRKAAVRRTLKRSIARHVARHVARLADRSADRKIIKSIPVRRSAAHRSATRTRRVIRHIGRIRSVGVSGNMAAVIAFARAQVGKNYVSGGEGPGGFDCSGFTRRAYARAGLRLPHSSGAQAARAHTVSRSRARAGDLVVGAGHVGIYMGGGMMIDAGNRRVGVVYRHLYSGLHIERF